MTTDEYADPTIEARQCGNTYQVYIGPNAAGTFTRHSDEAGTPYYNAWLGAQGKPRVYATEEEATAAVVWYYRTGK